MRLSHKLIALAALALGACSPGYSYRYRVTVEVDTPQGVKSGSGVWETTSWQGSGIPDTAIRSKASGEAVAVDLPGGTLFALMRRGSDMNVDYPSGIVYGHLLTHPQPDLPFSHETNGWTDNVRAIARSRAAFELYPDEYPLLVRFRDLRDPASVEKVDPGDLAASFGPGVHLKRITIAVTRDGVTDGIAKRMPWLKSQKGSLLKTPPGTPVRDAPFGHLLTEGDFVAGGL